MLSLAVGSFVGTKTIADEDNGNGDSGPAIASSPTPGFPMTSSEQVLIQARGTRRVDDAAFRAAIHDVESAARARSPRRRARVSARRRQRGQVSADGRSALVSFELRGDDDQAAERVDATLAAVADAQYAHPDLRIEEFGDASIEKAAERQPRARTSSAPRACRCRSRCSSSSSPSARWSRPACRCCSRSRRCGATLGLLGPISQLFPVDEAINSVVLLDRSRRRRRLLAVLPAPRA